jgi:hypothetical protein
MHGTITPLSHVSEFIAFCHQWFAENDHEAPNEVLQAVVADAPVVAVAPVIASVPVPVAPGVPRLMRAVALQPTFDPDLTVCIMLALAFLIQACCKGPKQGLHCSTDS